MASRHPTDAERRRAAEPTVRAFAEALAAGDAEALAALHREDAVLLLEAGTVRGRASAEVWHRGADERWPGLASCEVTRLQQHGAHAVVGWLGRDAGGAPLVEGLSVLEVRRDEVVWQAVSEAPAA